jgi:hypothetical protein
VPPRGLPQKWKLAAEFIQHGDEALGRCPIGGVGLGGGPECLDDQIDWSIVKMESSAIRQKPYLGSLSH